jgi:hypothetical protein
MLPARAFVKSGRSVFTLDTLAALERYPEELLGSYLPVGFL